jgi:cardiolipin synthase
MDVTTTQRLPARPLALPNLLTYARIAAVPAVVACMYWQNILQGGLWLRWIALAIFVAAAITDFLDGYFARIWSQQSTFGRMLDPIADKLLVASCLLMLAADDTIKGRAVWAAIVILCREILVSGLREYLAELRVSVPVTQLAKWKTTVQLVAIGFLLAGLAGDNVVSSLIGRDTRIITDTGIGLLWLSALVTLYTGYDYFRAGVRHLIDDE